MRWRNLLIWVVILAALGAFVYFYEFKGEAKREAAKEKAEKLFDIKEEDITSIRLIRGSETSEFARKDGKWELTSPVSAPADQSALNDMVTDVATTNIVRSLNGLQDLTQFGLQPPRVQVTFKTRKGSTYDMSLGDKDYSGSNMYAKVSSQSEVVLIPAYLFSAVDKSQLQLRDRKVLSFDSESVSQIKFDSASKHFLAQKSGTDWALVQPVSSPGDSGSISSYLSDLTGAEAVGFVDHPESNPSKYGLAKPTETIEITSGQGSRATQKKLLVGVKDGDNFYVQLDGSPTISELTASTVDKFVPDVFKLRDKRLVTAIAADLQRMTIQAGKEMYSFDRDSSKEAAWKIVEPKTMAGKTAQEWKFWFPLEDLTADEMLDPPQSLSKQALFASPAIHVTYVDKSNHSVELKFSKPEKDKVWVQRSDSKSVYQVASKKVEDWISGLKDLSQ